MRDDRSLDGRGLSFSLGAARVGPVLESCRSLRAARSACTFPRVEGICFGCSLRASSSVRTLARVEGSCSRDDGREPPISLECIRPGVHPRLGALREGAIRGGRVVACRIEASAVTRVFSRPTSRSWMPMGSMRVGARHSSLSSSAATVAWS
jgi:hypothetical protein